MLHFVAFELLARYMYKCARVGENSTRWINNLEKGQGRLPLVLGQGARTQATVVTQLNVLGDVVSKGRHCAGYDCSRKAVRKTQCDKSIVRKRKSHTGPPPPHRTAGRVRWRGTVAAGRIHAAKARASCKAVFARRFKGLRVGRLALLGAVVGCRRRLALPLLRHQCHVLGELIVDHS